MAAERVLGPAHPDTLTSRNNLADTERVLSPGHPFIELVRSNPEHARSA
ncbi:hypothetical protein ACFCV8_19960 [Streptomyces sp. NPDC056347]